MLSVIYGAPWRCGIWTTRYRFRHPHAQATRHISSRFTLKELHQRRVLRANSATDVLAFTCSGYSTMSMSNGLPAKQAKTEDRAVSKFREYLRINTVQPDPDYGPAIKFLQDYAKELNLSTRVTEIVQGNPILVMTWTGVDPSLPSVLLNSHMDVVPVYPEHWKYDPFEAVKEDNGNIYARGSQCEIKACLT
ncbi:aminoacylase-1-like [Lingula anatina]|uniref:Aminoacylase-1-like n=1 Tax=Lingula anatina TaxID=7574 RepID=A0A1S3ID01_LINAN|nr:aminoacylase-1-like [Lingula anatina]|eukprot:XP_013396112.1 aminoacylase-1-like [Lingula anatina]